MFFKKYSLSKNILDGLHVVHIQLWHTFSRFKRYKIWLCVFVKWKVSPLFESMKRNLQRKTDFKFFSSFFRLMKFQRICDYNLKVFYLMRRGFHFNCFFQESVWVFLYKMISRKNIKGRQDYDTILKVIWWQINNLFICITTNIIRYPLLLCVLFIQCQGLHYTFVLQCK